MSPKRLLIRSLVVQKLTALRKVVLPLVALSVLSGCGPEETLRPQASSGQVKPVVSSGMSTFAAARLAEQTTFGVTPSLIKDISSQGASAWIDAQMALPVNPLIAPSYAIDFNPDIQAENDRANAWIASSFPNVLLTGPDQLRLRVSWALFQYMPVGYQIYGTPEYYNRVLWKNAFGNYRDLLRDMTVHPAMGVFLNNNENRAVTSSCLDCAPNENFARELLQLFSVGVVQLNPDGSVVRDASGRALETYTQKDVEELARALTGWEFAPGGRGTNFANYAKDMIPSAWEAAHDRKAKVVMGKVFPAGREAPEELETILDMLMAHPNIAPFVSLRMIQHLVTSDPTPQYLSRVSAAFRNNGQGVTGDMKAVIKAVLLDPEARAGDVPGGSPARFGKLREPVLWWTAALRGLGCTSALKWRPGEGHIVDVPGQNPLRPPSVFSHYLPTDRAPGSNLLAPEQKLLGADQMTARLGMLGGLLSGEGAKTNAASGCQVAALAQAYALSPQAFVDEVSTRWFRGAMPPTLRNNLIFLANSQGWASSEEAALTLLQFALATPYFGVMK